MQDGSVSPIKSFFRNKWVRLILIVDFLAIIGIIALIIYNATRNSIISFTIAPIDATITVNGDSSYRNGSFQLHPGNYEITISHDGLNSKTFNIELQPNSNAAITTFLGNDGNFDFYELNDNYSSFLMLSRIASSSDNQTTDNDTSAEKFIADFQKNYDFYQNKLPIIDKTPSKYGSNYGTHYQYDTLTIQKGQDLKECIETLCLYITDTSGDKEEFALSVLRNLGVNPNDFQIIYRKISYD